ncbi:MAG TPA: hypothetical protein PK504_09515 [Ferruginibacter sp.]|nr:hypothetical protein [Ferruginibacter sp.]HRE63386.1 hypothetical protein [Ferruginibacter sp.]
MKNFLLNFILSMPFICFGQNVGIGTPTPQNKLHIVSLDSNAIRVENSNALNAAVSNAIYFKTGSWFTGAFKQTATSSAHSRTGIWGYASGNESGLKEYLSITDDGNVGINTITPTAKLSVNGNLNTSANIAAIGSITAGDAITVGPSNTNINGSLRYVTTDQKMEYRENGNWKRISKPYYQSSTISMSSAVRNTLLIHPSFEWVVPETGTYQVNLVTDMYPVFKTNGCQIQYLDNAGGIWVYSKTRSIQFFESGQFKWYIVTGQTGCSGAQSIPLKPSNNKLIYLQKDEIMTLAFQIDMYTVPGGPLDNWTAQGTVNFVKID